MFILLAFASAAYAVSLSAVEQQELRKLDIKTNILKNELTSECPQFTYNFPSGKEVVGNVKFSVQLEAKQEEYAIVFKELYKCHQWKLLSKPQECLTAEKRTESWRLDHNGGNIRPGGANSQDGYACDLHDSNRWFRFTGAAGNRLLNSCPKVNSCGSKYPIWSDAEMPTAVGQAVAIDGYVVLEEGYCKYWTIPLEVMKCSDYLEDDFIYKLSAPADNSSSYSCGNGAFCGME